MTKTCITMAMAFALSVTALADDAPKGPTTITDHTARMERHDGYFTYYWDEAEGKIWLEIARMNEEILYVTYLSRGL